MTNLVSKDENVMMSPTVVGYKVLSFMAQKKVSRMSIFDIADHFRNEKWFTPKALYFSMIFLFTVGIIDFKDSYIIKMQS